MSSIDIETIQSKPILIKSVDTVIFIQDSINWKVMDFGVIEIGPKRLLIVTSWTCNTNTNHITLVAKIDQVQWFTIFFCWPVGNGLIYTNIGGIPNLWILFIKRIQGFNLIITSLYALWCYFCISDG